MRIKQTLLDEVAKKVNQAGRKRIWPKAFNIAETLGKKNVRVESSYATTSYEFNYRAKGLKLDIRISNYVMGGNYMTIATNDGVVFQADEIFLSCDEKEKKFPQQIAAIDEGKKIFVKLYLPGDWEKLLNLKKLQKALAAQKKGKAAYERDKKQREETERPLTQEEKELAKNFGL
jgi:hypothetical protein